MPSLQHAVLSRLIGVLRPKPPLDDVDALKRQFVAEHRVAVEAPPARVRSGRRESVDTEAGFPVVTLRPEEETPTRAVFYLHGGAYVRPSDQRHWHFAVTLADAIGAATVVPLYPLAPECTVDDSFEAMADRFEAVAAEHPDGVVLVGDSAGGGYALALAQELRDRARRRTCTQPERLVLIAPWVDLTGTVPGTEEAQERDPWLSLRHLRLYGTWWGGSEDHAVLTSPRRSPLYGDLTDLPPALMLCGTRDLLQPQCDALFDRADESGWALEYHVSPGLIHVYPILRSLPEARAARAAIVDFVRQGAAAV